MFGHFFNGYRHLSPKIEQWIIALEDFSQTCWRLFLSIRGICNASEFINKYNYGEFWAQSRSRHYTPKTTLDCLDYIFSSVYNVQHMYFGVMFSQACRKMLHELDVVLMRAQKKNRFADVEWWCSTSFRAGVQLSKSFRKAAKILIEIESESANDCTIK